MKRFNYIFAVLILFYVGSIISLLAMWTHSYDLKTKIMVLESKNRELVEIMERQDRIIQAQREHFKDCSFISKMEIKKVTNKYWVELRRPLDFKGYED